MKARWVADLPLAAHGVAEAYDPSQFGLGCVNLGNHGRAGVQLVHHALDLGVRVFDTADAYGAGQSERVLGRALKRRRHLAYIATKGGYLFKGRSAAASAARNAARPYLHAAGRWVRPMGSGSGYSGTAYGEQNFSATYLRTALEGSLRRLGTDFVDLYQLHGPKSVHDEVLALMVDLRSEGKIRGFGVGFESLDTAKEWLETGALSSIQIPFGVLDPEAGVDVIPRAAAQGVSVIVRGVFAGGFVAQPPGGDISQLRAGQPERLQELRTLASANGVDPMQLAAWFATGRPGVSTVLVGASSVKHLSDGVRYVGTRAPEPVLRRVEALAGTDSAGYAGLE